MMIACDKSICTTRLRKLDQVVVAGVRRHTPWWVNWVWPVHVNDTETMVQCGLGDKQVRNRRPVPHAMVMSEISLQCRARR